MRDLDGAKFKFGQRVTKIKGSSWTGHVVGFYSTSLTLIGYAVESENEPGSVQIYPEAALRALQSQEKQAAELFRRMNTMESALRAIIDTLDAEDLGEGPPASEWTAHWQKLHDAGRAALEDSDEQ